MYTTSAAALQTASAAGARASRSPLERLRGPQDESRRRRAGPTSARPTGRPSTKPHGTLVTGSPRQRPRRVERRSGSRYGSARRDRRPRRSRRDDRHRGATSRSKRSTSRAPTRSHPAPRAQAGRVGGRGQQRPASRRAPHVGAVVGEPRPHPGTVDRRRLGQHHRAAGSSRRRRAAGASTLHAPGSSAAPASHDAPRPRGSACSRSVVTTPIRRSRGRPARAGRPARSPRAARRHSSALRASGPTVSNDQATGTTPPVGDEPDGRPVAGHAAERGRDPDRAGGVGAERAVDEVGGDGRAAAAARAAAVSARAPTGCARGRSAGCRQRAERELVRVQLADDRRAGRTQPLDALGVAVGRRGREDLRRRRRPLAGDVDHVLDAPDPRAGRRSVRLAAPVRGRRCSGIRALTARRAPRSAQRASSTLGSQRREDPRRGSRATPSRSSSVGSTPCRSASVRGARRGG